MEKAQNAENTTNSVDAQENGGKPSSIKGRLNREGKYRAAVIFLALLACILLIAVILVAVLGIRSTNHADDMCATSACLNSALFLLDSMNTSVDPCEDFYQFSCGNWISSHMDEGGTDVGTVALLRLYKDLKGYIEVEKEAKDTPQTVKNVIRAYDVCSSFKVLTESHLSWLRKVISKVGGWPMIDENWDQRSYNWPEDYTKAMDRIVADSPIMSEVSVNPFNTSRNIIFIGQPDTNKKSKLQKDVILYIASLLGNRDNASLEENYKGIELLEKLISDLSQPEQVLSQNPNEYFVTTIRELDEMIESVDWLDFIADIHEPRLVRRDYRLEEDDQILIMGKTYLQQIIKWIDDRTITKRMIANYVAASFVQRLMDVHPELMSKNSRLLSFEKQALLSKGSEQEQSVRCLRYYSMAANPAIDYIYFKHKRDRPMENEMVKYAFSAMNDMVKEATWLDEETKHYVLDKLEYMIPIISFPPWVRNVTAINEYFRMLPRITENAFENKMNFDRHLSGEYSRSIHKNVDRSRWPHSEELTAAIVNAAYLEETNALIIPAGIQTRPFYHPDDPMFMKFGAIGTVIGHEITHGFDVSGSKRDKFGNSKNWWTPKAKTEFEERSKCFVDQYGSFSYGYKDYHVDGKQTLSENIADNGGVRQAFLAYSKWERDHGKEQRLAGLENYDSQQLFFVALAQTSCSSFHPSENVYERSNTDTHTPDKFRTKGIVSNMKEFSDAFKCKPGSPMNPKKKCIAW